MYVTVSLFIHLPLRDYIALSALLKTEVLLWTQIAICWDICFRLGWVCFPNLKHQSERIAICVQGRTSGSSNANKGNDLH